MRRDASICLQSHHRSVRAPAAAVIFTANPISIASIASIIASTVS